MEILDFLFQCFWGMLTTFVIIAFIGLISSLTFWLLDKI